jgi:phosphoribosylanthranilate isomerase
MSKNSVMNTNRVRVKICGITRPADAVAAANAGADAIGMNFWPRSERVVDATKAMAIIKSLPPFVTTVGLFVNQERNFIQSIVDKLDLDLLQFHGDETQEDCIAFSKPFTKAIRMMPDIDLLDVISRYELSRGILLDSYVTGKAGGTGYSFDWDRVPQNIQKPVILAGGLNPDNVHDAIEAVKPYAVDVSGGVESEPGIKDALKIIEFVKNVRSAS